MLTQDQVEVLRNALGHAQSYLEDQLERLGVDQRDKASRTVLERELVDCAELHQYFDAVLKRS